MLFISITYGVCKCAFPYIYVAWDLVAFLNLYFGVIVSSETFSLGSVGNNTDWSLFSKLTS